MGRWINREGAKKIRLGLGGNISTQRRRDAEVAKGRGAGVDGWMGGWVFTRRREGTKLGMGAGVVEFLVLKIALP
jgi:hypothetical protein